MTKNNMSPERKFILPFIGALLLIVGLFLGYNLQPKIDTKRASKFEEVLRALEEKYVDSVNKDQLFNDAVNEMLHKLDPHSRYISKKDLLKEQQEMQGSFGGIGVRFQLINDTICVISAMSNGPAYKAGLRSGDQIIYIEGKAFTGKKITNDMVLNALRGEVDTYVNVTALSKGAQRKVRIQRGEIAVKSVPSYFMMDAKTGYIRISQFSLPTHEEFINASDVLLKQGMKAMVLDLRGNPGGVMDAAVAIADEFLPKGDVIVSVKGKSIKNSTEYAQGGGKFEQIPLVVLIDESSASAAEILAGAIQDNDRGKLVGRRTYGKGLVQQDQILRDGSSVRMTISRYYTPSGRSIQRAYSGNYEQYIMDEQRFRMGELFHLDSIPVDKSKAFKTKKGRVVYGGGGIVPDVFVPLDTSGNSLLTSMLFSNQLFSEFAFKYLQQDNRNKWTAPKSLARYNFTIKEWRYFETMVENKLNLKGIGLLLDQEKNNVAIFLKEELARQLWQESLEIRYCLGKDNEIREAKILLR